GLLYNNSLEAGPVGDGGTHSREMIYGGAGIGSEIEKIYDLHWKYVEKIKHTIEPFATYSYIPRVSQGSLPLYDEVDRMESRSLISYGLTSRIFAKLPASLAQGPESADQDSGEGTEQTPSWSPFRARTSAAGTSIEELFRFTLLQAYDFTHAVTVGGSRFSDL